MNRCKVILGVLLVGAFCLLVAGEAQAQGGRWDWIRKMSGPGYRVYNTIGFAVGVCLNSTPTEVTVQKVQRPGDTEVVRFVSQEKKRRCLELGTSNYVLKDPARSVDGAPRSSPPQFTLGAGLNGGGAGQASQVEDTSVQRFTLDEDDPGRPDWEWMVGVSVSGGWDGTNDENGIADVKMLIVQPSLQVMRPGIGPGGPYASIGLGVHRFWGGTAPEPFWNPAAVAVVGYRLELAGDKVIVSAGLKVRYFFDRMDSDVFGGSPDPDDGTGGGEWAVGMVFGLGWRFNLSSG